LPGNITFGGQLHDGIQHGEDVPAAEPVAASSDSIVVRQFISGYLVPQM